MTRSRSFKSNIMISFSSENFSFVALLCSRCCWPKKKEWISKFVDIVKFQDRTPAKTKLQNISAWPNQTACHLLLIRVPVVYSGSPHRLHWGGKGNVQSFIGHNVTICKLPLFWFWWDPICLCWSLSQKLPGRGWGQFFHVMLAKVSPYGAADSGNGVPQTAGKCSRKMEVHIV